VQKIQMNAVSRWRWNSNLLLAASQC